MPLPRAPLLLVPALVLLTGRPAPAGQEAQGPALGERFTDKVGGFSLCLPKDWKPDPDAPGGTLVFIGAGSDPVFQPRVMLSFDESSLSVEQDLAARENGMSVAEVARVKRNEKFRADGGAEGLLYQSESAATGKRGCTRVYRFPGPPGRLVGIAFWYLLDDAGKLEPVFDAAAKTYRVEPAVEGGKLQDDGRWVETEGGYSFIPPKEWRLSYQPGSHYKQVVGPGERNRVPTILFGKPKSAEPLATYVENCRKFRPSGLVHKDISHTEFATDQGLKGVKLVYDRTHSGSQEVRRFVDFIFNWGADRKLQVHCMCTTEDAEKCEKVFDECIKTLRMEVPATQPGAKW